MADDRWTAETEELAICALWEHGHLGEPLDEITRRDEPAAVAFTRGAVRAVLDSLARSGCLLPVGGETRQEWCVQSGPVDYPCSDEIRARHQQGRLFLLGRPATRQTRTVTTCPDGTVITSAWREVTDDPA